MKKGGKDIFTPGDGLIVNAVIRGRNEKEVITSLQTFTGMAFQIPEGAQAVIKLPKGYEIKMPEKAWEFTKDTPTVPGEGLFQGAYMPYGKGRIIIFGEAAMFTAQLQGNSKFGMNAKSASQNAMFLLNTIHWLDGTIP